MYLNTARRGQILYVEGNGATHLYAIRTGRVKLVKVDVQGRSHVTGILRSGDLFGFEAIFEQTYGSGAEAMSDCELCLASADQLRELIAGVPSVATDIAKYLHGQLSAARDRQVAANATGAPAKVAAFLLQSIDDSGGGRPGAGGIAAAGLTLREVGGILGLAHETVCRVLADFRARGLVESLPSGYRIQDVDSLRTISGL
jgi:CRP/FNR family transcriptional regulator